MHGLQISQASSLFTNFQIDVMWHYICITGASRGFGKALALRFAKIVESPVHFSLSGLSRADLEDTKKEIMAIRSDKETKCDITPADLSDISQLRSISDSLLTNFDELPSSGNAYSKVVYINNAGSLGPLDHIGAEVCSDVSKIAGAINLNVTASCFLTSEVMRKYKGKTGILLVNVSSLCAVQPFDSLSLYCANNAARDMFYRVLALENEGSAVRILNYATGSLDTDMQKEIRECPTVRKETQEYFKDLKEQGKLIPIEESAAKCTAVIFEDSYENGTHIDFSDVKIDCGCTKCNCVVCQCGSDCKCGEEESPRVDVA